MPGEPGQVPVEMGGTTLPEGWERSETAKGIPYYINHGDGASQWEHPDISEVVVRMDGMNEIKFAAYRTAMKLRTVQKVTHLNVVSKNHLERAFFELGLATPQSTEVMTVQELEALLSKLFHLAQRGRAQFIQPDSCVEVTLSWLLKCLDSGRTALVKVRTVKVVLAALCTATVEEKFTYMFQQTRRENSPGISKSTLKMMLKDLLLLPLSVSENATFKIATADNAVENCWRINELAGTDVLNEEEFLYWALQEPLHVVWLPTLHRLSSAETVKHEAKCAKCKAFPIVGFRYRCLKCTSVDFCQSCYWTQQSLKNHKATHPVREYCLATTTGDDVRDFAKQLKYKLTRKYRNKPPKKIYLDYPTTAQEQQERIPDQSPLFANIHSRANQLAARLQELGGTGHGGGGAPNTQVVHVEHHGGPIHSERPPGEEEVPRGRLQSHISGLEEENEALRAQMDRLAERLREVENQPPPPPAFIKVPVPVGRVPATPEMKTQAVNTVLTPSLPSVPTFATTEWSSMYGGEEDKMEELLQEVLAAFPTRTTETVPCDLDSQLLRSAQVVGSSLGAMVFEVASALQ
ncbi:dystrophin-like isoform X2 [Halichondria panicea]|uniref:dystrophin-like isoform X2 n=1 Tax=Halichondria panicea TaxID=6063 RepID=UPI00312BA2E4